VGYARDPFGIVHLRGSAVACFPGSSPVLTLPAGFRPAGLEGFIGERLPAVFGEDPVVDIRIFGNAVGAAADTGDQISLSGITFRCAPSGQNGCP
jgi:hypothetical protein